MYEFQYKVPMTNLILDCVLTYLPESLNDPDAPDEDEYILLEEVYLNGDEIGIIISDDLCREIEDAALEAIHQEGYDLALDQAISNYEYEKEYAHV